MSGQVHFCRGSIVVPIMSTPTHLNPTEILKLNARTLAEAKSRADFPGPQMVEHRKPNPGGGPCDVCGCTGIRLGVLHKARSAESPGRGTYVVYSREYSGDWSERVLP